jgi:ribosomal-protein-alanine N-acetyltransferase
MSHRLIENDLPWWCWTPKRVAKVMRAPDTVAIVAMAEKRIAGFAIMHFDDDNAHLNLLAVEPEFRQRQVGSRLLEWLHESCAVAGILSVSLEVRATNKGAIRFYETFGFKIGERIEQYYCGQEAAVRMSLRFGEKP